MLLRMFTVTFIVYINEEKPQIFMKMGEEGGGWYGGGRGGRGGGRRLKAFWPSAACAVCIFRKRVHSICTKTLSTDPRA